MRSTLAVIAVAAALSGCASLKPQAAPVCDGKDRRPANPYGSVLAPSTGPAAPTPAPAEAAEPEKAPDELSAVSSGHRSCGA